LGKGEDKMSEIDEVLKDAFDEMRFPISTIVKAADELTSLRKQVNDLQAKLDEVNKTFELY
jgi:polyhydroxyalkanoate synthesis regulator phasin